MPNITFLRNAKQHQLVWKTAKKYNRSQFLNAVAEKRLNSTVRQQCKSTLSPAQHEIAAKYADVEQNPGVHECAKNCTGSIKQIMRSEFLDAKTKPAILSRYKPYTK